MAKKKSADNLATEVAKTVGSALGTIAATTAKLVDRAQASITTPIAKSGARREKPEAPAKRAPMKAAAKKKAAKASAKPPGNARVTAVKKKKAQHKKKIARKTGG